MPDVPDPLPLVPTGPVDLEIRVPGSKSLTNRALAVAALADGVSELSGALIAEDRAVMADGLRQLGIDVEGEGEEVSVHGAGGRIPAEEAELDLRLSGTAIRFLAAICALGHGSYRLDGNARMRERPIRDQLDALRALGADAVDETGSGCPPIRIEASGLRGGTVRVAGDRSSQYLSALLMAAPAADGPVRLEVQGELLSKPFVDMTIGVMEAFGVSVVRDGYAAFDVAPSRYHARAYEIEADAMAAGYFWAAAAVTGGRVRTPGVGAASVQGDRRLADVLDEMGCRTTWERDGAQVVGPPVGRLRGGTFDLNDMPDQAQTLAVCALFADEPVRIENVWNLRIKETDRLAALARELSRLGATVVEEEDALTVHPLEPGDLTGPVTIETYGDHRMAMAFAVAGLRLPGLSLRDPGCVAKTYPGFFEDWSRLAPTALS
ncbi:MAG: 3-phosphoshikimate 1-carboxyvinyltransferase [Trueperaceae bacterium]|nr:3-phosphoshikimate 1-carboxyvinyltransferase [Trueperaceae bacterium]